jgi:hypothetical protein
MKKMKIYKILTIMIIFLFFSTSFSAGVSHKDLMEVDKDYEKEKEPSIGTSEFPIGEYDLLIIAPRRFKIPLMRLVNHKNRIGVKTILYSVEEVYNEMYREGRDDAEKIKYFIKNANEQWGIQYVLLVGGRKNQGSTEKWWIPVRYSYLNRNYANLSEGRFLTDLYFADLYDENGNFSSWDSNDNGIFGEWPKDEAALDRPDLFPDVFVGRLPCINIFEVMRVVRKIIRYETGKFDDSWFKTMVVVAGDTYPDKTEYVDGEVYTQKGLNMMPGFRPVKLWTSDGSLKNWIDVVKAINKGCGFIWFSGHGNPKSWSTHPPHNKTWIHGLEIKNMRFLFNRNKLPVCVTGSGCFNNMFNVSLFNSPWVSGWPTRRCFSWALVVKRNGGSIAAIGATAFSYESPDIDTGNGGIEWLDMHFFGQYGLNNTTILGNIWGNTITTFLQNFSINWDDTSPTGTALIAKNAEQWHLIGDPSLMIGGYAKY